MEQKLIKIKLDMNFNMLGKTTEENCQRAQQIFKGGKLYGMRKISARLYISRKSF